MSPNQDHRASLGTWPTPLEPLPRLARALGLDAGDLWIKRDDLTGLGGGGNKLRKLEWTCGAALAEGATTLVTTGAPQSNHARLTAAAGARLGLDVVLVLAGEPGTSTSGNIALDGLLGARIVWAGDHDPAARAEEVADELRSTGAIPAVIPFGGSSVLGAQGYVECARELLDQAPDLDTVVTALDGWISTSFIAAKDGRQVAIYSQWRDLRSVEAMQANPAMQAYFPRIAALAAFDGFTGDVAYARHS